MLSVTLLLRPSAHSAWSPLMPSKSWALMTKLFYVFDDVVFKLFYIYCLWLWRDDRMLKLICSYGAWRTGGCPKFIIMVWMKWQQILYLDRPVSDQKEICAQSCGHLEAFGDTKSPKTNSQQTCSWSRMTRNPLYFVVFMSPGHFIRPR